MKGTQLGEFEELVLLTVGILNDNAYALSIIDELRQKTNRKMILSSVHKTLVRLDDKGYLESHLGQATEVRGGREKRLYKLTQSGINVLNQTKELRNMMWDHIPRVIWEGRI